MDEQVILRNKLTDWAVGWANNEKLIDTPELYLFLDRATQMYDSTGVKSESLGDYSVTIDESGLDGLAIKYLKRFRRMRW